MTRKTWSAYLSDILTPDQCLVAGLMSGTSADGVDVALCRIDRSDTLTLVKFSMIAYPREISEALGRIHSWGVEDVSKYNVAMGRAFGEAVRTCIGEWGEFPRLIGSHGQTVYHHSGAHSEIGYRSTLQIGCADTIAAVTGVPVVSDFRGKDIAFGGEGAPLTPYSDYFLFGCPEGTAVLNLGGIANLTELHKDLSLVRGFDIGPANAPLDRITRKITGGAHSYDRDGVLARSGVVQTQFLEELLATDSFIARVPPKSTGFEMYGDSYIEDLIVRFGGCNEDLLATIVEFIAVTTARAVSDLCSQTVREVVVAGGGAKNVYLLERIRYHLGSIGVKTSDECGVPVDAREAMAFALLAYHAVLGRSTSLPGVTGAQEGVTLGRVTFPR